MRIERFNENDKLSKVQDKLNVLRLMLEKEFNVEDLGNFASSSIDYNKGFIEMNLNFAALENVDIEKIMEIKKYLDGCLKIFVLRPCNDMVIECHFRMEHNGKFMEIYNELKMKSDAKKYNV